MSRLFAVTGNPILHSRSPQMHNAAFKESGEDAIYFRLCASSAEGALRTAREMGIEGMNVTSPYKEEMAGLVRLSDDDSLKLKAVNTVLMKEEGWEGHNTDPDGVVGALGSAGLDLGRKKVIVVGAGGAAKAAVLGLQKLGARPVIANRTLVKAEAIGDEMRCSSIPLDELETASEDAAGIICAISTDERVVPKEALRKGMFILDAKYSPPTALVHDAKRKGCRIIDGSEWLLFQGVGASKLFGVESPPIDKMRKALRRKIAKRPNISFIGFMGSGKNTVAKELGIIGNKPIIDMDAEIVRKAGMSIAEIFRTTGQEAFRKMENREISRLRGMEGRIACCGGGCIIKEKNRKTLKAASIPIWLWASPKSIVSRVRGDKSRPLLDVPDDEKAMIISSMLESRMGLYAETADMAIDTQGIGPEEIARRINHEIRETFGD